MADDALVVADLHIGLEEELREKGVHIPSRAEAMGRKLAEIASRRGASRIIILGDVKHLVPKMASRERRDVYVRSEEHTSELQSPCNIVCRLLLEKKKEHQEFFHVSSAHIHAATIPV